MLINLSVMLLLSLLLLLLVVVLLLLWPCSLLLITLYLVANNEYCSVAHGAHVEFVWWGGVCTVYTVIFMSNPTTVLRLCCVVVGVVTTTLRDCDTIEINLVLL